MLLSWKDYKLLCKCTFESLQCIFKAQYKCQVIIIIIIINTLHHHSIHSLSSFRNARKCHVSILFVYMFIFSISWQSSLADLPPPASVARFKQHRNQPAGPIIVIFTRFLNHF